MPLLNDPQLSGGPTVVGPPNPGALETFGAGVESGFQDTSVGLLWQAFEHHVGSQAGSPITEGQYNASPDYRPGQYEQGMTDGLARVKAAQYDEQQRLASIEENGPTAAKYLGKLVGGALDPLYYIPYVDTLAPEIKAATIARAGGVVGAGLTQATNAAIAGAAEQPLAAIVAHDYGQDYDAADAAKSIMFAALVGGVFGGLHEKLGSLSFDSKVTGIAKTLDDINMGRPVDAGVAITPQMMDEDRLRMDSNASRAQIIAGKAAAERTPDEKAFAKSFKKDQGATYYDNEVQRLSDKLQQPGLNDADRASTQNLLNNAMQHQAAIKRASVDWTPTGPNPEKPQTEPDLSGLPLTDADKAHLANVDELMKQQTVQAKLLRIGASCNALG